MSSLEVVEEISIRSSGFIWSRHTTINDQELTILDELSDTIFLIFSLLVPPHFEEFHLGVGESSLWVLFKLLNNGSEHTINRSQVEV